MLYSFFDLIQEADLISTLYTRRGSPLVFQAGTAKMCHSPKVDDGVDIYIFF